MSSGRFMATTSRGSGSTTVFRWPFLSSLYCVRSSATNKWSNWSCEHFDPAIFIVTPDFGSPSHLKYLYDAPSSLHVLDMAIVTLRGTIVITDIRLRLTLGEN